MNMLEFRNIYKDSKVEESIKELYINAFPAAERMPYFILKRKAKKKGADFFGIYDDNQFVGLLYCVIYHDILFVFYLAIAPECRGQGYGSRVLKTVEEKYGRYRIVLNIEEVSENSPNYEQRLKRRAFYEKNGFFTLDYQIKEGSVVYDMMCFSDRGNGVSQTEYYKLMESYLGKVLYLIYRFISR